MILRFMFTGLFALFFCISSQAQTSWTQINTVEEICDAYPQRMKNMLSTLDLHYPGLEHVKEYADQGQVIKACSALLDYYKGNNHAAYLRSGPIPATGKTSSYGDSILQDVFLFYELFDQVARDAEGHLDWTWDGPGNDIEWAWALNRHHPVRDLLAVYSGTGNPKYIRYIDQFIKSWVIKSLPYPGEKSNTAMWRGLEVSFRVKVWANVFYQFINTGLISPATQLLILSSLPEHGHYACHFHGQGNWLTMEMSGLATLSTCWPEFKESGKWLNYAIGQMTESLKAQVYPDGVQTELTSHYHTVALQNFLLFNEICERAGKTLPEYYTRQMENMWGYLARSMRPDGYGLMNNDSDLVFNRPGVLEAARKYRRPDWEFIAANEDSGTKPEEGPSYIFPWAGQVISRNNFSENAHWSFFDIGPWGSGHQHNDKLHISLAAFGKTFLVDGGRFAYRGEIADKFRGYARGSSSHNLILIDGKGQAAGPKLSENPVDKRQYLLTDEYDYAWGTSEDFNDTEGIVSHQRTFFYLKDRCWIIIDKIRTDRPRKIEALWHWNPGFEIKKGTGNAVYTQNDNGNLFIQPLGLTDWKIDLVKGQEKPVLQGWYSKKYNEVSENYTSIYAADIKESLVIPWLIVPYQKNKPGISANIIQKSEDKIHLEIKTGPESSVEVILPFNNSNQIQVLSQKHP